MTQKILIVGNGPAGISAVGAARLNDRSAEITVVDTKEYDTFHPCAMPFVIGKYLPSIETIIEDLNYDRMGITLHNGAKVVDVDVKEKKAVVKHLQKDEETTVEYDKLILCTGSNVFIPPITGKELGNVFSLKFAEDAQAIKEAANAEGVEKIAVVGGSAIGIEVASELSHLGKEVTIIEMQPQLMPFKISKKFADLVEKNLSKTGVTIKTNMMVKEIIGKDNVEKICYGHEQFEETIDAQLVVLATGVRPNIDLAKKMGVAISDQFKGIIVNDKMETNLEDVYAAGDCIVVNNILTKQRTAAWLAGPAVRQGRVAGLNATGGNEKYPGSVNSFIVSSRTFFVGLAGLNEDIAEEMGKDIITAKITAPIKPHYMPTSKEITLKLVAQMKDGKILGLEAIGPEKVDVNVNYIVLALHNNMTVYDLMDVDFCYAPAVSETIYPLVKTADAIIRKIERKKERQKRKKNK
jgi:NADH oxidase (H2O2-forming)